MNKKKPTKQKHTFQQLLNSFPTNVSLSEHDKGYYIRPKTMQKKFKKQWGVEAEPCLYHPILIQWSEKGRGFGEYAFWQLDGQIFCDNECDSRDTVKKMLCHMVDQAIFIDATAEEIVSPEHKRLIARQRRLFHSAITRKRNKV